MLLNLISGLRLPKSYSAPFRGCKGFVIGFPPLPRWANFVPRLSGAEDRTDLHHRLTALNNL
jgi:hypothetical protein